MSLDFMDCHVALLLAVTKPGLRSVCSSESGLEARNDEQSGCKW